MKAWHRAGEDGMMCAGDVRVMHMCTRTSTVQQRLFATVLVRVRYVNNCRSLQYSYEYGTSSRYCTYRTAGGLNPGYSRRVTRTVPAVGTVGT